MRTIKYIVVHCTASSQLWGIAQLEHEFYKVKKWKNPGYHYVITADGKIHQMLADEKIANGVKGYNSVSIHVAYVGGVDVANKLAPIDNRTFEQRISLYNFLKVLRKKYPTVIIQGHRDFPNVAKACPCFDAKEEYKNI